MSTLNILIISVSSIIGLHIIIQFIVFLILNKDQNKEQRLSNTNLKP